MAGKEQQEDIYDSIFHWFGFGSMACFYIKVWVGYQRFPNRPVIFLRLACWDWSSHAKTPRYALPFGWIILPVVDYRIKAFADVTTSNCFIPSLLMGFRVSL